MRLAARVNEILISESKLVVLIDKVLTDSTKSSVLLQFVLIKNGVIGTLLMQELLVRVFDALFQRLIFFLLDK